MKKIKLILLNKETKEVICLGNEGFGALGWDFDVFGIDTCSVDNDYGLIQIEIDDKVIWENPYEKDTQ